ncbi:MAG TPA: 2'-5' RNA ligase family protein [Actinospica sp.]|nr:2'-5' RNA ligase family protein [Actinospica sp.]
MANEEKDEAHEPVVGTTALLLQLPDLAAHLKPWVDQWPHEGFTTHVTILVPFVSDAELGEGELAELRAIFEGFAAFDVTFARSARFATVLYLAPEPEQPFRAMTSAVYERWPQCPPYAGVYPDATPHVSVVYHPTAGQFEAVERELAARLPLTARAAAVDLLVYDGSRWNLRERFPLRAS